jgi:diacylglycerol kinase (ATP)
MTVVSRQNLPPTWAERVRIFLIINAKSPPAVEELREQVDRLRSGGHEVHPRLTFEAGDACRIADQAAAEGADLVIAAGGDGTINEVANGLYRHLRSRGEPADAGSRDVPRLALIPLGTANDLANNLGIPGEIAAAIDVAVRGEPVRVNVGEVNGRCFLNVSTGGFGAEATGEAPAATKRALGTFAYLIEAVKRFAALEPAQARFVAEEEIHHGPFLLFAVGNFRRTGGGTALTPLAQIHDDLLDVCIVKEVSRVEFLGLLPDLRSGNHLAHPAVIYRQVRSLEIESDVELHVNADGEPMRDRYFRYSLSPDSLVLMVPKENPETPAR